MTSFYKLLLFLLIFGLVALTGFLVYRKLNSRLKSSQSTWGTVGFALLLIVALGVLFIAGIYLLIYSYTYLK